MAVSFLRKLFFLIEMKSTTAPSSQRYCLIFLKEEKRILNIDFDLGQQ